MAGKINVNRVLTRTFTDYTKRGIANARRRKLKYILEKYTFLKDTDEYIELKLMMNMPSDAIEYKKLSTWGGLFTSDEGEILEEFGNKIEIAHLGKRRVNKFEGL